MCGSSPLALAVSVGSVPPTDRALTLGPLTVTWSGLTVAATTVVRSVAGTEPSLDQTVLILFGMMGLAVGAFQ